MTTAKELPVNERRFILLLIAVLIVVCSIVILTPSKTSLPAVVSDTPPVTASPTPQAPPFTLVLPSGSTVTHTLEHRQSYRPALGLVSLNQGSFKLEKDPLVFSGEYFDLSNKVQADEFNFVITRRIISEQKLNTLKRVVRKYTIEMVPPINTSKDNYYLYSFSAGRYGFWLTTSTSLTAADEAALIEIIDSLSPAG